MKKVILIATILSIHQAMFGASETPITDEKVKNLVLELNQAIRENLEADRERANTLIDIVNKGNFNFVNDPNFISIDKRWRALNDKVEMLKEQLRNAIPELAQANENDFMEKTFQLFSRLGLLNYWK